MLSSLFIYLICQFLAIQRAECAITIDPITYAAYPLTMQYSLNEMVAMAQAVSRRTEESYNRQVPDAETRVVFYTFDAYFRTNNRPATISELLCMSFPKRNRIST